MECPRCRSGNREGVKFCEECGAPMEIGGLAEVQKLRRELPAIHDAT